MKTVSLLILIIAQNPKILEIRKEYDKIQSEIRNYDFKTKDHDWSSERGDITGYFKDGVLKKIVLVNYGSIGQEQMEFFYNDNGSLFFVFTNELIYNMEGVIDPNSKSTNYEVQKSFENRYYMDNNVIIRWLDAESNVVDSDDEIIEIQARLLKLSERLCQEIEEP